MASTRYILENVFGMLGIIFWSFQLLPQVYDCYRSKNALGLSRSMFLIWTVASLGFGSYGIVEELSIPIIVQPHIFGVISAFCWLQCQYYGEWEESSLDSSAVEDPKESQQQQQQPQKDQSLSQRLDQSLDQEQHCGRIGSSSSSSSGNSSNGKGQDATIHRDGAQKDTMEADKAGMVAMKKKIMIRKGRSLKEMVISAVLLYLSMAAIEAGAVFATKAGLDSNVKGTVEAAGILPVILLGLGFVPQYRDILRDRYVQVSMPFIAADAAGSVFSLVSLALRESGLDLLAFMNYVIVLLCDLIVVGFFIYFNRMQKQSSLAGASSLTTMATSSEIGHSTTLEYPIQSKESALDHSSNGWFRNRMSGNCSGVDLEKGRPVDSDSEEIASITVTAKK